MKLNEKIRELRENKNLTQADVAEKLDLSVAGYAKIERGITEVTIPRLEQLANIFEVDMTELLPQKIGMIIQNNQNTNSHICHIYNAFDDKALHGEIEKLKLIIAHRDETIKHKNELIETLNEQINDLRIILDKLK